MPWNPDLYLKFGGERTRPAVDLVARIEVAAPRRVIDLGCGTGNSTAILRARWPDAEIMCSMVRRRYSRGSAARDCDRS